MFASVRQIRGRIRPNDDVESLLYLLAYCLDGFKLPWQSHRTSSDLKRLREKRVKNAHSYFTYFMQFMPEPLGRCFEYISALNRIDYVAKHKYGDQ